MTPAQIKQVLNIRMLRADKAERALREARNAEAQAVAGLNSVEVQLARFDANLEVRIAAFQAAAVDGMNPESLHSARSFHADLARERTSIESLIDQARQVVRLARDRAAAAHTNWVAVSSAAGNLKGLHKNAVREHERAQDRLAEQDADELSLARSFRETG